ncbi:MAG: ArsR/SmtB family transcription factor [Candidatus Methanofastidiosia archaeon]
MIHQVCCPQDQKTRKDWEENLEGERQKIPKTSELKRLNQIFKVLSHPTRLRIAYHLSKRDFCVCELVYLLQEERNVVSYHLTTMRKKKLIKAYMKGGWKYYQLSEGTSLLLEALNALNL